MEAEGKGKAREGRAESVKDCRDSFSSFSDPHDGEG